MAAKTPILTAVSTAILQHPTPVPVFLSSPQARHQPTSLVNQIESPSMPPSTPDFLRPASLQEAIALFYLRVKILGPTYLSALASTTDPSLVRLHHRYFAEGMKEHLLEVEDRLEGSLYEGMGMRILVDAVLRGRTPYIQWLSRKGVDAPAVAQRKVLVGELKDWFELEKKNCWRQILSIDNVVQTRREDSVKKMRALQDVHPADWEFQEHCLEFDREVERSGVKSLKDELDAVGEWPDGCDEGDVWEEEEEVEEECELQNDAGSASADDADDLQSDSHSDEVLVGAAESDTPAESDYSEYEDRMQDYSASEDGWEVLLKI